ncbi:MAG: sulfotransferase [Congregibacter sp.]
MNNSSKYLFILSPPYSGSTVLWQVLQTSSSVSALPDEGQKLPELAQMMRREPWNPATPFDWPLIYQTWRRYWDLSRPILLEKSPPHLCRYAALDACFKPANYLLLLRDPIATCEALHRRNSLSYTSAARRWLDWLRLHIQSREHLANTLIVYYEDMTDDPTGTFTAIADWMPELADVDHTASVEAHSVHGVRRQPLLNLNASKLQRVSHEDRAAVLRVLETEQDLLAHTRYGL